MKRLREKECTQPFMDEILCEDVITLISSYLDKSDESQAIKSERRRHFSLFRSDTIQTNRILAKLAQYAYEGKVERVASLLSIRPDLRLQVLFTLAGLGAQDEMEPTLKEHPEDLLIYLPLRDISGAVFERISLFQHALWAKDVRYMANMMLDCLPKNEVGEQIRLKLVEQYEGLMANGVVYHLHGVKHENERHFDLQPLFTALRTYVEQYGNWTEKERELHWCTVVGHNQTLIPAHIRHHCCDQEKRFLDNPNFEQPKLKRSLEIFDWMFPKKLLWSEGLFGLGEHFAICGNDFTGPFPASQEHANSNLSTLMRLNKVRTTIDLPLLIKRLYTPIQNLEKVLELEPMNL